MSGAIPPLPQYAFMAWCSVQAQGYLYLLTFRGGKWQGAGEDCIMRSYINFTVLDTLIE
jgi:hypothetical protein